MSDRLRKSTKKASHLDHSCSYFAVVCDIVQDVTGSLQKSRIKVQKVYRNLILSGSGVKYGQSALYTRRSRSVGIQDSPVTFGYFNTDKGTRKISTENTQAVLKRFFLIGNYQGKQAYI